MTSCLCSPPPRIRSAKTLLRPIVETVIVGLSHPYPCHLVANAQQPCWTLELAATLDPSCRGSAAKRTRSSLRVPTTRRSNCYRCPANTIDLASLRQDLCRSSVMRVTSRHTIGIMVPSISSSGFWQFAFQCFIGGFNMSLALYITGLMQASMAFLHRRYWRVVTTPAVDHFPAEAPCRRSGLTTCAIFASFPLFARCDCTTTQPAGKSPGTSTL